MGRARRNVQGVVRHDRPFTSVLGRGRGLGLPPRTERLLPADLDGYAQFGYMVFEINERSRASAEGELPLPYRIVATTDVDAETWTSLCQDIKICVRSHIVELEDVGSENTTTSIEILREVDGLEEYSADEWDLFDSGRYYDCTLLRSPDGETLLLTRQYKSSPLVVGWPCPSPDEDKRPWVTLDPSFIGRCEDGYDDDTSEAVLRELSDVLGMHIVCVWDRVEDGCCCGDSEWLVVAGEDSNQLVDLPGRVWDILADSTVTDTRVNTASVGRVPSHHLNVLDRWTEHNYVHPAEKGADEIFESPEEWTSDSIGI